MDSDTNEIGFVFKCFSQTVFKSFSIIIVERERLNNCGRERNRERYGQTGPEELHLDILSEGAKSSVAIKQKYT